ncbi:MAG: K(+)-transporting ATPase subunit C [Bryobacterales bacterium]|nr:K(+)-transporting ATPase subunit C [Bryobacterales bacterium]
MWRQLLTGLRMTAVLTVLTGLLYPGLVTGICQFLFPSQANGSLIERDGKAVGSVFIGQRFTAAQYFHPRPSAAGSEGYDASASGASNLGPTSQKLIDRIQNARISSRLESGIPADLLTSSGSGLDPHISPASAHLQVARVAEARGISDTTVAELIGRFTEGRDLGFLGESRVNVLLLNLALDEQYPVRK